MDGSPPDYDNDTAHRKRQPPYAADNPAHDIDFSDPKLQVGAEKESIWEY